MVVPKCSSIATQAKPFISKGPLAKGFLSQGRSSETWPLGNESVARRLGDLRSLLALQSQRSPNLLLSSKGHFAKRKDCEYSENKNLELQESDGSLTTCGSGCNGLFTNQCELEIFSGVTSSLDHPGPKFPRNSTAGKCDANSGGPVEWSGECGHLLAEGWESHQLVFSGGGSSHGHENCPEFGKGSFYFHRSVEVFKSRSQQNVFGDVRE